MGAAAEKGGEVMGDIRIGVSSCLLGAPVRYDGRHKREAFITDTLGSRIELVGVCPEVECGLGVPREPMRLAGAPARPGLVAANSGIDHSARMRAWARRRVAGLERADLHGFIFKARSPSCGMEDVGVFGCRGGVSGKAPGIFAKALMARFPALPCEDEARLRDPDTCENFIERVFALWRFRRAVGASPSLRALMTFHAQNKLLIQAHSETLARELGRALARLKANEAAAYIPRYEAGMMRALKLTATVRKHTNILQHMLGHLRGRADKAVRKELAGIIESCRRGLVPPADPIAALRHCAARFGIEYLEGQYYLHPHPLETELRNHARLVHNNPAPGAERAGPENSV